MSTSTPYSMFPMGKAPGLGLCHISSIFAERPALMLQGVPYTRTSLDVHILRSYLGRVFSPYISLRIVFLIDGVCQRVRSSILRRISKVNLHKRSTWRAMRSEKASEFVRLGLLRTLIRTQKLEVNTGRSQLTTAQPTR